MSIELRPATVRVPCSTSNLGAGFDTLGVALTKYLRATFTPGGSGISVERSGTLADLDLDPADDALVRSLSEVLEAEGAAAAGALEVHSEIPVARGLGSSAAAHVAGYELARAVMGKAPDRPGAFRHALTHEGHGDNAAPCALGGLQGVVPGPAGEGPRALALELSRDIGFAYAAPADGLSTERARAALPEVVPHGTAVTALGRMVALLRGLAVADGELIRVGFADELHIPYRIVHIPEAGGAIDEGIEAGAWGVTISGAGSGLIGLCPPERAGAVAQAMKEALGGDALGAVGFALRPDWQGPVREKIEEEPPAEAEEPTQD